MKGGLPKFLVSRKASDGVVYNGACRVLGVMLMGGSDAAAFELNNSSDNSGDDLLTFTAEANVTRLFDFTQFGGVLFDTAAYADIAGTGAAAHIWYEPITSAP